MTCAFAQLDYVSEISDRQCLDCYRELPPLFFGEDPDDADAYCARCGWDDIDSTGEVF